MAALDSSEVASGETVVRSAGLQCCSVFGLVIGSCTNRPPLLSCIHPSDLLVTHSSKLWCAPARRLRTSFNRPASYGASIEQHWLQLRSLPPGAMALQASLPLVSLLSATRRHEVVVHCGIDISCDTASVVLYIRSSSELRCTASSCSMDLSPSGSRSDNPSAPPRSIYDCRCILIRDVLLSVALCSRDHAVCAGLCCDV